MSNPYEGDSTDAKTPGIKGTNTATGDNTYGSGAGVWGSGNTGSGVYGFSNSGVGVLGYTAKGAGVYGQSVAGPGVNGVSQTETDAGVYGINNYGEIHRGAAPSDGGPGVQGQSLYGHGVVGSTSSSTHAGVSGVGNYSGCGVYGVSGFTAKDPITNVGVFGGSGTWDAIVGETQSDAHAGVTGRNLTSGANGGAGIYGTGGEYAGKFDGAATGVYAKGTKLAAQFDGTVQVNGNINMGGGDVLFSDCAEQFDVSADAIAEPGTVMVINGEGELEPGSMAYDKRAAGVVSGAGDFRPGIVLGAVPHAEHSRVPVALVGKVYCKVDATDAPIAVGDMLTTSPTPGHAMKACDPARAFGAVIGKALRPLATGTGLIPILIALQ
jgi:hypothetical protein